MTPSQVADYDLYSLVRLVATFTSTDGVTVADPSSIYLFTRNDVGSVATYLYGTNAASIVRAGTGAYWKELTPDVNGNWAYRWQATGGVQAADEWRFMVPDSFIFNR